jgi:choline kinase
MTADSLAGDRTVDQALVLAAGNGDRFRSAARESKLLQCVLGRPLIIRTVETARAAGITKFEVVLGYQAERVRAAIEQQAPADVAFHFTYNPNWQQENGVSVLAAQHRLRSRFALLMGDHLFEARALQQLLLAPVGPGESVLAVDSRPAVPEIAAEATKVRLHRTHITAIGKALTIYDALDTGLFVCAPSLFAALAASCANGDTTLSGGIRTLAARGLMRAFDIGDASWYDIDTVEDLRAAESLLVAPLGAPIDTAIAS